MFGIFKKKQEVLEFPLGSYRIVPTIGYTSHQDPRELCPKELLYQIQIYDYHFVQYIHTDRDIKADWGPFKDYLGNQRTFNTQEEAIKFFKDYKRSDHKAKMHMMTSPTEPSHPHDFILDELKEFGIGGAELTYDFQSKTSKLVFNSDEDMNFYKLSGIYQEISELIFTSKETI